MLPNKIAKNFKEISKFFVENFDNSASAIFTVLDMLKLSDKSLCLSTNYNAKYSQTVKFILILLMPFFRIRNVLNYCKSIFYSKIDCGKDTLYRFKRDNSINFRKINFHIAKKLRNCIDDGTDSNSKLPECLIIDDTDLEKTGCHFEQLGKIFSHVTHSYILGYKLLSLIYNDGKLTTAIITSRIGGLLRIRFAVPLQGDGLRPANPSVNNPLLMPAEVAAPKISPESTIQAPAPTKYYEYDVETQEGQKIRLSAM